MAEEPYLDDYSSEAVDVVSVEVGTIYTAGTTVLGNHPADMFEKAEEAACSIGVDVAETEGVVAV